MTPVVSPTTVTFHEPHHQSSVLQGLLYINYRYIYIYIKHIYKSCFKKPASKRNGIRTNCARTRTLYLFLFSLARFHLVSKVSTNKFLWLNLQMDIKTPAKQNDSNGLSKPGVVFSRERLRRVLRKKAAVIVHLRTFTSATSSHPHICRSRSSHPHICRSRPSHFRTCRSRSSHLHTCRSRSSHPHTCRSRSSHLHICRSRSSHSHICRSRSSHFRTCRSRSSHLHTCRSRSSHPHTCRSRSSHLHICRSRSSHLHICRSRSSHPHICRSRASHPHICRSTSSHFHIY